MAAAGGQVFLLDDANAVTTTGDQSGAPHVVDMVGAIGATSFETAATGAAASTTSSLNRAAGGADTDNNAADFSLAAPSPSNTASGGGGTPTPTEHTIAEIQGTGDSSPLAGQPVITEGVVTASYPTGGFFGYVIQTDGTGAGSDATPGASDAVFVYQPSGAVAVHVGDYVQVTGTVSEFSGLTELTVPADQVTGLGTPPKGGVTPLSAAYPTTAAGREAHESELIAPTPPTSTARSAWRPATTSCGSRPTCTTPASTPREWPRCRPTTPPAAWCSTTARAGTTSRRTRTP
jgi:5'-nucleotidase